MAIREIVFYPDERLQQSCDPVEEVNDEIRTLVDDMIETMYDARGVGLAAPQIGVLKRITVIDARAGDEEEESDLRIFINPEIVEREESIVWEEGCLSIPGVYEKVKRSGKVKVRALGRDGEPFEVEAEGLLAVALQHEIDHLDGVLFLERLSHLKRRMALKRYKKFLQRLEEEGDEGEDPDEERA